MGDVFVHGKAGPFKGTFILGFFPYLFFESYLPLIEKILVLFHKPINLLITVSHN